MDFEYTEPRIENRQVASTQQQPTLSYIWCICDIKGFKRILEVVACALRM